MLTSCVGGVCSSVCAPGFADCDHNILTGCEALTLPENSGICGRGCSGPTPNCAVGGCTLACVFPTVRWGTTCVTPLLDPNNCGLLRRRVYQSRHQRGQLRYLWKRVQGRVAFLQRLDVRTRNLDCAVRGYALV